MATPPLNSPHAPLAYRIGTSDRAIGAPAAAPDGFAVFNQTNGKIFIAQGGLWTDGGTIQASTTPYDFEQLVAEWYATNATNLNTTGMQPVLTHDGTGNVTGGAGYRIGTSDRVVGQAASAPEGFYVLNTTNGNVFVVQGGVWATATSFPDDLKTAWLNA